MKRERVGTGEPYVLLMLDSGAFSAWNQGTSIDIKRYIKFLRRYEQYLFSYVTLDVLPAGKESERKSEAKEECARLSDINQQRIKDAGLHPIPVFHQDESFKWLELMLKNGEPYIGISARKDLPHDTVRDWLDTVFTILTDRHGRPLVRTHGFGITAMKTIFRYPWYTTDSTTWALSAGFGLIYVPIMGKDGQPDYTKEHPYRIVVSGSPQEQPGQQNRQFDRLGPSEKAWVRRFLEEDCGLTLSEARNNAEGRRRAILRYYVKMAEALRDVRFRNPINQLPSAEDWHAAKEAARDHPLADIDHLRIMYATSCYNKQFSKILNDADARTRLVSYYEVQDRDPELLLRYVAEGTIGPHVPQARKHDFNDKKYVSHRQVSLSTRHLEYPPKTEEEKARDGTT